MNNNNWGLGRFVCEHPFITWFIADAAIELVKYGIYAATCLSRNESVNPPTGFVTISKESDNN